MTLRILNDDPRCLQPLQCKVRNFHRLEGLCSGCEYADRTRKALARFKKRAPKRISIPQGYEERFAILMTKVGWGQARALILDEAARDRAKEARAQA